ncbi:DUF6511 domain-containing protein [Roseibium aggregatum]|uniref:Uncharacterized protein n=1 Tax=Roseibium aggregatum TaxID=187304 RepID=A0A0M6Y821_9HYPH|nr:DUF6511 domain-containing protein [Roseibium aggregatum]CTQ45683.1 hypothetical protein LAL4801_04138 [Roseibium aggregatum]
MIDPTDAEISAKNEAKANAAEYLMSEGLIDKPLNTFSSDQVDTFLWVVIDNYTRKMRNVEEIPF